MNLTQRGSIFNNLDLLAGGGTWFRSTIKNLYTTASSKPWLWFAGPLVLFIILRLLAWRNVTELEYHDSVTYLGYIKDFTLLNFTASDPDSTPFYPFFSALFSLPGWSLEVGARLCSLVFSVGIFILIIELVP